jgi:hypothetical protein
MKRILIGERTRPRVLAIAPRDRELSLLQITSDFDE